MKKKFLSATVTLATVILASNPAHALHRTPVKSLVGYKCMALDAPESVMMDFKHPVSLQSEPDDRAPSIAPALAVLPVEANVAPVNGYVRSMNLALRPGWVSTKWLKPYGEVHPGTTCSPYIMNDGKLGFVFGKTAP